MAQTINLSDISKFAGSREILSHISIQLNPGEKYGLIGPNGCGKTTLLNILSGRDKNYEGVITGNRNTTVGYVQQNPVYAEELSVNETVLAEYGPLIRKLRLAEEKMADPGCRDLDQALEEYQQARDAYDKAGIDEILSRTGGVLDALGMPGKGEQPVAGLSGGEKNLLEVATALVKQPDLLLLDEPGNHLDFRGLAWLEEFLKNCRQTVIMVSHNRYLLDWVCSRILELRQGRIKVYKGNYSWYRMNKLKQQTAHQADYAANRRRLEQLEKLVKRFEALARRTADPKWGKRLRARKSQLNREQAQAVDNPLTASRRIRVSLDTEVPRAAIALRMKEYSRAFGDNVLFDNTSLEISCGEKVGLVGPNGCGKTTLIRDIVQQGSWDNPQLQIGPSLQTGYMAQQQELLEVENTIEDEIRKLGPLSRDAAFQILSRFLFTWQDLEKRVGTLSGGEINRLQLARLVYLKPDFLILDEPTNHLDIYSREVVEEAVCAFRGTLLVVSHDRYFLDKVVDRIVEVKDRQLVSHAGGFSEYWLHSGANRGRSRGRVASRGRELKQSGRTQADTRQAELEKQIAAAEEEKLQLEREITRVFERGDHQQGRKLSVRLEKLVQRISKLYAEWERLG